MINLNTYRFRDLQEPIRQLILGWFQRSSNVSDAEDSETFEPFIYCWIAFNAWAACVTGEERDSEIIKALAGDQWLGQQFMAIDQADSDFHRAVLSFQSWWPIFKVQDLRRSNVPWVAGERRKVVCDRLDFKSDLKRSPKDDARPWRVGSDFPLTWSSTIWSIYQVRCNLFHGDKNVATEVDQKVVGAAFRVLVKIFGELLKQ